MSKTRDRAARMPRALKLAVVVVVLWLPLMETAAAIGTKLLSQRGFFYLPHDGEGYRQYLARRDPVVGWPPPDNFGKGEYDAIGSRIVPAFPEPEASAACASFFGDSFTFSDEVEAEDSYPNQVAKRLGCRVNNFGVGGYGTDQALLRYRDVVRDDAPWVVLGHYSENIIRNINQYRDFLGGTFFGLKPRFVLDARGELELIPLPSPTPEQFARIANGEPVGLQHEYFYPGGPAGVVARRFPYTLSALRFLGHYRLQARLRGEPSYAQFYDRSHDSGALALTQKIIETFVATAEQRGQQPLVVLIPDQKDLEALREHGRLPYEPLRAPLLAAGVPLLPIAEGLDRHLGAEPPHALYHGAGHFNPRGYAEVARLVAERLRRPRETER